MSFSPVTKSDKRLLRKAARMWGVQADYISASGQPIAASDAALIQLLEGISETKIESVTSLRALIVRVREEKLVRVLEPVYVFRAQAPQTIIAYLPDLKEHSLELQIQLEEGGQLTEQVRSFRIGKVFKLDLKKSLQKFTQVSFELQSKLPIGYHRAELLIGGQKIAHTLLMCAPELAQNPPTDKKTWGVFAPLYGIRSETDWGCGDLRDMREFQDVVHAQGASFFGTLPMLAAESAGATIDPSPYSPVSRIFWNEIFLPVEELAKDSVRVQVMLKATSTLEEITRLRKLKYVDHGAIWVLKRPMLLQLAEEFFKDEKNQAPSYQEFVKRTPLVEEYAQFRSQRKVAEYQYHLYVQFQMDQALRSLSDRAKRDETAGLYLDFPVGASRSGFDAERFAKSFFNEVNAGAPPDLLFAGGQNWGFAPLHPVRIREQGYEYFIQCLRQHMRYASILRIDHAMAFKRIYAIPQGCDPKSGAYVRYRSEEFFALLAIEAMRFNVEIVGEDLGTVPASMRTALDQNNCLGMWVLPFEAGKAPVFAAHQARATSLACLNTHDMVPFEGYVAGRDIELFAELGLLSPAEAKKAQKVRVADMKAWTLNAGIKDKRNLLPALLELMAQSPCELFLINIEDLWQEREPQNVPGTWKEFPNWTRKLKLKTSEWSQDPKVIALLNRVTELREKAHQLAVHPPELAHLADRALEFAAAGEKESAARMIKSIKEKSTTDSSSFTGVRNNEILSPDDLYLFNEGRHHRAYSRMGAHQGVNEGHSGTWFAVWAPDVAVVTVIGDFNGWNPEQDQLHPTGSSGIWSGFVIGAHEDQAYKYRICTHAGAILEKADPFAFYTEEPPRTASRIRSLDYEWQDTGWMNGRKKIQAVDQAMSIYEMHAGSWKRKPEEGNRSLTYRELAEELPAYLKEMNFTHVEFMPLMEHPFYGSWGYQTTGYFAPTSRYGTPQDFMYLIDKLHQAGIGIVMDWVPSHFPEDSFSLGKFNGTSLYEHDDPRLGYHPDWKSLIFNYGRHEVRSFLISSALFWLDKFHIDALRVDAVASMLYLDYSRKANEWIPNKHGGRENLEAIQFLQELNEAVYRDFPDVHTIAEESTAWPKVSRPVYLGGLGFGMKWDMGWMHDTLEYFKTDSIYRNFHQGQLTFRMVYAFNENFVLSISHDEVVYGKGSAIGKMSGDTWQKFANLRTLYAYMYAQPGKKLLFMGSEFGQLAEWNHESSLDWHLTQNAGFNQQLGLLVKDLNRLYRDEHALHELDFSAEGFEWLDASDSANSVMSFFRKSKDGEKILCVFNMTPLPRTNYRLGVTEPGVWKELMNTDAVHYGGSGMGNMGQVRSNPLPLHGRLNSLTLTLPPLAAVYLKFEGNE